jgi:flagellar biosynthesis/type III secretory pathway protein FliH
VAKRRRLVVPSLVADVRVDEAEAPLATADEPPVEEVLLAAGEKAEQAEAAEAAEAAEEAEGPEEATPEPIALGSDRGEGRS